MADDLATRLGRLQAGAAALEAVLLSDPPLTLEQRLRAVAAAGWWVMAGRNSITERVEWARAELLKMRSSTDVVSELTQRWGCSRRTAQRLVSRAHALFLADLEGAGVNRTVLAAQLEHGLLTAFSQALQQNHPAAATGVAREIRKLLRLQAAPSPLPREETWRL